MRTLRLWRSEGLITKDGRKFTRRNLLEVLATVRLRAEGLTPKATSEKVTALSEERLRQLLVEAPLLTPSRPNNFALVTLRLLAKGVLEQHRRIANGAVVGHTDARKTGIENTPLALRQAMARLGRLYFEDNREDLAASIHNLLHICMRPLKEWAPSNIVTLTEYAEAVLIDPAYRVPSEDCQAIAEEDEGTNLGDLVERYLHDELRRTLEKLGPDADVAYRVIREFVGRYPLVTTRELQLLYGNPELNRDAILFVQSLYGPVHASFAKNNQVRRCARCKSLIGEDERCILDGCRDDHPRTTYAEPVPVGDALIARPEVLKYWVDPAREELRLYDALIKADINAQLYPHSDQCDIAIGEDVGIDVKDYRDPVRLARKLNRSIGGLSHYNRRILALADRRADQDEYIERLSEQLTRETRERLELKSVTDTISLLKREYRRGNKHARQA
jgi:DNA-binding transcriptional MerR regulator